MKWATRSHIHVDRVACPWLISRFVDSEAEFLFVPKSQIQKVVEETGAIPFDAPGVELGHRDGKCSFETIVEHYGLADRALLRLARIVHSADGLQPQAVEADLDLDPIARGLEAIAVGYSLRFPDDVENLARQFDVYDALYAWCRLQVARDEHSATRRCQADARVDVVKLFSTESCFFCTGWPMRAPPSWSCSARGDRCRRRC